MTIQEIIANTIKEQGTDGIAGINVSIKDVKILDFFDNPKEVYFGKIINIPEIYLGGDVIKISQICTSSDESRNGAQVLLIDTA